MVIKEFALKMCQDFISSYSSLLHRRFELTLFGMGAHIGGLCEALSTVGVRALVRLESCVVVEVRLEVVFFGERLWADGAGEGLDS